VLTNWGVLPPHTTYDDYDSEIFNFFTWNRRFKESIPQRNGFPQGIDSMESMPGVLKSLKILALTYAGEVAVELSAHIL
jgi:hypothetical protein